MSGDVNAAITPKLGMLVAAKARKKEPNGMMSNYSNRDNTGCHHPPMEQNTTNG
jgi:hypothetical protein